MCPECSCPAARFSGHRCDPQTALTQLRAIIALVVTHPSLDKETKIQLFRLLGRESYTLKPEHMKHHAGDWEKRINEFNGLWKQQEVKK